MSDSRIHGSRTTGNGHSRMKFSHSKRRSSSGDIDWTSSSLTTTRPTSALRSHRRTAVAFLKGLVRFVKDITAFLVRGGVSSLMFLMDETLCLFLAAMSWIPGVRHLEYGIRGVVWLFQVLMWVVYTALELMFYLPTTLLILYIVMLGLIYISLPSFVDQVLSSMFWLGHSFLHLMKHMMS